MTIPFNLDEAIEAAAKDLAAWPKSTDWSVSSADFLALAHAYKAGLGGQDKGSSGVVDSPCGSQPDPAVGATAALAITDDRNRAANLITEVIARHDEGLAGSIDAHALVDAISACIPPPAAPDADTLTQVYKLIRAEKDHWIKEAMKHVRKDGRRSDYQLKNLDRARIAERIEVKVDAFLSAALTPTVSTTPETGREGGRP